MIGKSQLYQFSKICSDTKGRDTWIPAFAGMTSKAKSQSFREGGNPESPLIEIQKEHNYVNRYKQNTCKYQDLCHLNEYFLKFH